MKYKKINPNKSEIKTIYPLLISGIAPRPIALVGSTDKKGICNLAPFSFFNAFGANPPIVGFSPTLSGRTGLPKDTLLNINDTKEFTISIVTSDILDQVSLSSCEYDKNIDEFVKSGMTKKQSNFIKPPSVQESPFIMECELHSIIELGDQPASGNLILGKIVLFHINEKIIEDEGIINPFKIDQIGRSGGSWYSEVKKSLFKLNKPSGIGIGFDQLPDKIFKSDLTGKQLAKLASVVKIPNYDDELILNNNSFNSILKNISDLLDENKIEDAWKIILSWEKDND